MLLTTAPRLLRRGHPHRTGQLTQSAVRPHGTGAQARATSGDTKTPKSKRSLELPKRALVALMAQKQRQARERVAAGEAWHDNNLVFCHENGAPYTSDQLNWRFSKMTRSAGIGHWRTHEGRHTAVSIMSSTGLAQVAPTRCQVRVPGRHLSSGS